MVGTNPGTIGKLTGDPSFEITEALFRFIAREAKDQAFERFKSYLRDKYREDVKKAGAVDKEKLDKRKKFIEFTEEPIGKAVLPFIFDFALASALELVPIGQVFRHRLAYNFRVLAWEDIGHQLLELTGLGVEDLVHLKLALQDTVKSAENTLQDTKLEHSSE
jgi:hypothetical protein